MKRIVVTGHTGLLGKYLIKTAPEDFVICGISQTKSDNHFKGSAYDNFFDLRNSNLLNSKLKEFSPDAIIHCAAEGSVDALEGQIDKYKELNLDVSKNLSNSALDRKIKFVYVSSNAVFGGKLESYSDDSEPDPINDYGRLKVKTEAVIKNTDSDALIVRPILMYGWPNVGRRSNPVVTWIDKLRKNQEIVVVNDIWTQPLAAWDCARAIWKGLELNAKGTVNISGGTTLTLFELAQMTTKVFGLDEKLLKSAKISDFENLAPRPVRTNFDLTRIKNEFHLKMSNPIEGLIELMRTESN